MELAVWYDTMRVITVSGLAHIIVGRVARTNVFESLFFGWNIELLTML